MRLTTQIYVAYYTEHIEYHYECVSKLRTYIAISNRILQCWKLSDEFDTYCLVLVWCWIPC
jgi:hypothetical protein